MNVQLQPMEHSNQRILTTQQLAGAYETDERRISENFNRHKDRYIANKHYFCLEGEILKEFGDHYANCVSVERVGKLYLWTEKGAWLHAKSLNTDKAWEAYEMLVDDYYRLKEQPAPAQLEFDFNFDLRIRSAGDLAHARVIIGAAEDVIKAKAKLQRLLTNKSEVTVREIKPAINAPKTDLFDAKAYLLKYIEKLKDNPKDPPTVRNLERYATRLNEESIRYYLQWFIEQGIVYKDADHKSPYYYVI